jgi:hypothetical protein
MAALSTSKSSMELDAKFPKLQEKKRGALTLAFTRLGISPAL